MQNLDEISLMNFVFFTVMLIGGREGNVFTRNVLKDTFGPICGDNWNYVQVINSF